MDKNFVISVLLSLFFTSTIARIAVTNEVLSNVLADKENTTKAETLTKPGATVTDRVVVDHDVLNKSSFNYGSIANNRTPEIITVLITSIENTISGTANKSINEISNNSIDTNHSTLNITEIFPDFDGGLILTSYIEEGKIKEGREASAVDPEQFLGFESYSGYFTVNKTFNSNIFFWYFPALSKPVNETPWIIWLQGGPGVTSLVGLFDEMGPLKLDRENKLIRNPHTWLRDHSLLYIDNPVGTGFSYTHDIKGYARDMKTYTDHLYSTVKQFLQIFPELRVAPLFVAGESYGGKYAPALAMEIHKHKQTPAGDINLQGVMIGNALVEPTMITQVTRPFYQFGMLTQEQLDLVQPLVDSFHKSVADNDSVQAKRKWNNLVAVLLTLSNQKHAYNILADDMKVGGFVNYINRPEMRRSLHVGNMITSFVSTFVNEGLVPDFLSSTKPMIEELLNDYRVLAYCGHLDQMLPCSVTAEHYRRWKWDRSEDYLNATRKAYIYKGKLAGYFKSGGHFTEVLLRGAGHMAPMDVPGPAQELVYRWTHDLPIPTVAFEIPLDTLRDFIEINSRSQFYL